MRPLADFVKMAAFMVPNVDRVPYAVGGAIWQFVTGRKNQSDGFGRKVTGPGCTQDSHVRRAGYRPVNAAAARFLTAKASTAGAGAGVPGRAAVWGRPGAGPRRSPLPPRGSW